MNQTDFDKGWTIILSQPWAKVYRIDEHAEATQRAFVKNLVDRLKPEAWQQACWFLASQWATMPTAKDFHDQTERLHRTMEAEAERKAAIPDKREDFPGPPPAVQAVFDRMKQTGSVGQALREILPTYADSDPWAAAALERCTFTPDGQQPVPGWSKPNPENLGTPEGRQ